MLAVSKLTGDLPESIMPKASSNLKFPHQSRTNHLRNYKGKNTPHKMQKRNSIISAM